MLHQIIKHTQRNLHSTSRNIIRNRQKYLAPSLRTFEAYDTPFILSRGDKYNLWDEQNNKYIDLLGQNLCVSVGYGNRKVIDAATAQMNKLSHCTTMYYNEQSANLAKEITELLPKRDDGEDWVVHLVNDGSEAVDLAVQMARVYTGRPEFYSLHKAYHGLHGYAAGLTAIGKSTQESYSSMFSSIRHVCANDIESLRNSILYGTGGNVAGIIIEPLQGFGGIHALKDGYMKDTFELVKKAGGVTIADEVQTGYGRCGESFWGFQMKNNDVVPDMITIAKGMGNGVGIIGAVVSKRSIAEAFTDKMFFNTYGANPMSSAAARAVIKVMKEDKIMENCNEQGKLFKKELTKLCHKYPDVYTDARGTGLFQGLEIYGNTPEVSQQNAYMLHKELLKYGVIAGRGSAQGNVFRIQPPMCITTDAVNTVVDALDNLANDTRL
jgi:alanine-glyoxylate transaminase / (R)-3-amino-2-methylpropionate-pyruvate transaminase